MPGTSRLVPEARAGAGVAGRGRERSARCAGGRGAAERLADRAAGDHDGPGGGGRLEEAASVERRRQVVAVDVRGQHLTDQDPRLAVLLGLDLLDPADLLAACRRGTVRRERLRSAVGRRCGPSAPLGCGRRAAGPRGGRRTRWCAKGPQLQEERRRPRGHEGQGGQQAQHRRAGRGAVGEPGDRGHQAEHQERPQGDPGPTYADHAGQRRQQRDRDDDTTDQHRLVVLAERPDRELLERPGCGVDRPVADREERRRDAGQERGDRLRRRDGSRPGEQAGRTAQEPAAARGRGGLAAVSRRGLRGRGHTAGSAPSVPGIGSRGPERTDGGCLAG